MLAIPRTWASWTFVVSSPLASAALAGSIRASARVMSGENARADPIPGDQLYGQKRHWVSEHEGEHHSGQCRHGQAKRDHGSVPPGRQPLPEHPGHAEGEGVGHEAQPGQQRRIAEPALELQRDGEHVPAVRDHHADGRFQVRWRGGDWRNEDGT
jgi:hypothetical protein